MVRQLLYLIKNSLKYGPAKLEYGFHKPTQGSLDSIDFPPLFGDFSLHQAEVVPLLLTNPFLFTCPKLAEEQFRRGWWLDSSQY